MNNKINIKELLEKYGVSSNYRVDAWEEDVIEVFKEFGNAIIELCSENATAEIETEWEGNTGSESCYDIAVVNTKSILNVKNMINYE